MYEQPPMGVDNWYLRRSGQSGFAVTRAVSAERDLLQNAMTALKPSANFVHHSGPRLAVIDLRHGGVAA